MKINNSWKTTLAGLVSIAGGVILLTINRDIDNSVIAGVLITSGLGLIGASDAKGGE